MPSHAMNIINLKKGGSPEPPEPPPAYAPGSNSPYYTYFFKNQLWSCLKYSRTIFFFFFFFFFWRGGGGEVIPAEYGH